jgi:carbonic anhydrase/acetyltransferase-like protein (isoleucine patch superfamily)
LVPPDKVIPDGSVVMGSPGKIVREVGERERALIQRSVENYRQRAEIYLTRLTPLS